VNLKSVILTLQSILHGKLRANGVLQQYSRKNLTKQLVNKVSPQNLTSNF
jgi:hypothetical protein